MITSSTTTAVQQNNYYQNTTKTKNSDFDNTLKAQQTQESSEISTNTEEKKVDRMSFEFIKNIEMENIMDTINSVYGDLSKDEQSKIAFLRHLANTSENDTLNKVMFDEAKDMSPDKARLYSFQKMSEHQHYKLTGTANLSLAVPMVLDRYPTGIPSELDDVKLSHEEAFNMLLNMIKLSKEGVESSKGELQDIHKEYYEDYSNLLEKYNSELRKNMTAYS